MEDIKLLDLDTKKIIFKKLKENNDIANYLMLNENKKKPVIYLEKVYIPFGVEKYNGKSIVNIEINPKKNNIHYNYYSIITEFEEEFKKKDTITYKKLLTDIENKGYYPNIRESKSGYIIRSNIFTIPEIYCKITGKDKTQSIKQKMNIKDINKVKANIELELGSLWVNQNNYGIMWYVKKIEVLYAM